MKRILVVDDDVMITGLLSEYLRKSGYEVKTACNGGEAIDKVREQVPDLILLDIEMPEKDGLSTLKDIRQDYGSANLPIIILSAEDDKKLWASAMDNGANDFIQKPYDKIEILARVKTNLNVGELANKLAIKTKELITDIKPVVRMQETTLPQELSADGFDISNFYQSSKPIFNSLYDVFQSGIRTAFFIGYISQPTVISPVILSTVKELISEFFQQNLPLLDCINRTANLVGKIFADSISPVSLVLGTCDELGEELSFVSAGLNPAFIFSENTNRPVESTGPSIGSSAEAKWTSSTLPFRPGDCLFLSTEHLLALQAESGKTADETSLINVLMADLRPENQTGNLSRTLESVYGEDSQKDIAMMSIRRK